MYHIVRKGQVLSKKFDSYEAARSWVRKRIRKDKKASPFFDRSEFVYHNPAISLHGYTIFKFN